MYDNDIFAGSWKTKQYWQVKVIFFSIVNIRYIFSPICQISLEKHYTFTVYEEAGDNIFSMTKRNKCLPILF